MSKRWAIIHCAATPAVAHIDSHDIAQWHARMFPNWSARLAARLGKPVTGYNRVITTAGEVQKWPDFPVCPDDETGAHTGDCSVSGTELANMNVNGIGICMVGGVDATGRPANNFTDDQWRALEGELVAIWNANPAIERHKHTIGHRDAIKRAQAKGSTRAHAKACPSFSVASWLDGKDFAPKDGDVAASIQKREDDGLRLGFLGDLIAPTLHAIGALDVVKALKGMGLPIPRLAPETHTVSEGDTLWSISNLYGVPLKDLIARNGVADPNNVPVGTELRIYR